MEPLGPVGGDGRKQQQCEEASWEPGEAQQHSEDWGGPHRGDLGAGAEACQGVGEERQEPAGQREPLGQEGVGKDRGGGSLGEGPLLGSGVQAFSHGSKGAEQRVRTISAGGATAPLPTLCVALSLRLSPLAAEKTERLKAWQRAQAQKGCTDHKQLPPHGDSSWHHTKTVTSWQGGCEGGTRVQSQWVLTGARPPDQRAHPSWDPTRPPEHQTGGLPTQASVGKGEGGRQVTWAERLSADTSKHHPHLEAPAPHQLQKVRTGMN